MKLTKILGLAAVAAVAVTAFAGSASAARLHPLIRLCKKQELLLCSVVNSVEHKGKGRGEQIGTATLEGTINQKCTGGEMEAEVGEMTEGPGAEESHLLGKTTKMTFTGCEPCKKVTTTPPFTTNIKMSTETGGWTIEGAGNAKFEECSFGVTCKFGTTKLEPEPIIEMSETEAWVNTNKAVLKREEGSELFCGASGKLTAKYRLRLDLGNGTVHTVWPTLCKLLSETCL